MNNSESESCNCQERKSDCDSFSPFEKEILDDWSDEIGSLTDDDTTNTNVAAENQDNEIITDGLSKQTNLVNHETAKEGKKPHRPKLQHHLSWQSALKKAKNLPDPWEEFHIDDSYPTEIAIRHRYNALKKNWVQDEVRVKMESLVSLKSIIYMKYNCASQVLMYRPLYIYSLRYKQVQGRILLT